MPVFIGYRKFLSALGSSACQYRTTSRRCHTGAKTVFIPSLSVRGLKCAFHSIIILSLSPKFGLQNYVFFLFIPNKSNFI